MTLQLPSRFAPTHETVGLPGFPAIDVFADGGTLVAAPDKGTVVKLSGRAPTKRARPGGPYGYSIYLRRNRILWWRKGTYYLTHLGDRRVTLGQKVRRGDVIGTVADYSKATNGATPSHVHEGYRPGSWTL